MINYKQELNPEQFEVVMAEGGPILVIAGAGSGKTRTLTYRVARLVEEGMRPENIMLATFTNKAAHSMLSRVEMLTNMNLKKLWGGTFHHLANRTLRKKSHLLGYDNGYTIIDSKDSNDLISACISELGFTTKEDKFPKGNVAGAIISLSVNTKETLDEIIIRKYPYFFDNIEAILKVATSYRDRKRELNLMDFDDLLINWRELLVNFPDVLNEYSEALAHILVDEYQDTNAIQAEIVDLLSSFHGNLMVVGDDSQSIYSFRGADYVNIIDFPKKYPEVKVFKLETNYRSTPEILNLANLSIINNEKQFQKELRAVRDKGVKPVFVPVKNVIQQANFVTQRIRELVWQNIPLNEIAVLYRAHYLSMEMQMELTRRGIPFEIRSGIRFFEQAHIKDVTAYLRLIVNPFDELAWKRALELYNKIGRATANKVWKYISTQSDPLSAVLSDDFFKCASKAALPGLFKFQNTLKKIFHLNENGITLSEIIRTIISTGYKEHIQAAYSDINSREEDLNQLAHFSSNFNSIEDFLNELSLMTNMPEENDDLYNNENDDRVVLSSIHQAKGLEWRVVFLIWCTEGKFPLSRALKDHEGEDEERRLFYVATTRAKDQLYLSHPLIDSNNRYMGSSLLNPSRFIKELAQSYLNPHERPFEQWIVDEE